MKKFTQIIVCLLFALVLSDTFYAQTDTLVPPVSVADTAYADSLNANAITSPDTISPDTAVPVSAAPITTASDTAPVSARADTAASALSDTVPKPALPKKIVAEFDTLPFILEAGEIVSKQLQVGNGTERAFSFTLKLTYPGGWKPLTNPDKIYTVNPGERIYIPVRIVPQGKIQGNTKYLIYAYVVNDNQVHVAGAHFLAEKKKIINWTLDVSPDSKIYLLNDENTADFSVNVFNIGNEAEELTLDMSNYRQDRVILMDTNDRILKKPFYTFSLEQQEDTNFYFRAKYTLAMRNYRLIDNMNYNPNYKGEAQRYSIFAQSRESAMAGSGSMFKGKKIDIIRLNNEHKVNPFHQAVLPMVMEANISNILVSQPIMNLMFNGATTLQNGAYLTYYANSYFSTYFANYRFFQSSYFNIGYYDKKFNLQVGNNAGGASGLGIAGNYFINNHHTVGGFIAAGPLFNPNTTSYGLNYQFTAGRLGGNALFSRAVYSINRISTDNFSGQLSYALLKNHFVSAGVIVVRNVSTNPLNPYTLTGYTYTAGYGGSFFKNRLNSSIGGSYSPGSPNGLYKGRVWTWNHRSNFSIKKWNFLLNNLYRYREQFNAFQQIQTTFTNTLTINPGNKSRIAPTIFYNVITLDDRLSGGQLSRFHSRGAGMNYGTFDFENNRMMGVNFTAGYNKALDIPDLPDFFFFRAFYIFRYRVWSGNIRYTYGSITPTDLRFVTSGDYPQSLGISLNKQHQFRNPHFVLDNNLTYNYYSALKKHSLGYTPQLYYFTNSGWRFYITPGYYFTSSNLQNRTVKNNQGETVDAGPNVSHSFLVTAGVRKEFGIPLPWKKEKYPTLVFRSFIDHNGDSRQDVGEVSLENVVVKLGEWETLSDSKGIVTFRNVFGDSTYSLSVFSLVDLNGYFPNVPATFTAASDSSVQVPFVKGVKVHGNVFLDRDKIAPGVEKPLDLSGIKITALNGKAVHTLTDGKGNFSFYVPFGKYTISMDEKVLGERFTLLQNNIELELDQKTESIFLTFYIVEKRRKITVKKFNGNGSRIKNADTTLTPKAKTLEQLIKEEEQKNLSPDAPGPGNKNNKTNDGKTGSGNNPANPSSDPAVPQNNNVTTGEAPGANSEAAPGSPASGPIDKSQIKFKVQIGAYNSEVPNAMIEKIKSLPDVRESKTEEGLTRFTAGEFPDYESAQALRQELISKGISTDTTFVIIIADYKGRVFSADEAKELLRD